mgnify:CR=1 FL=1
MKAKKILQGLIATGFLACTLTFSPQADNFTQMPVAYAEAEVIDESDYPDDIPIARSDDVSKYVPPMMYLPMPDKYIRMYDEAIKKSPKDATLYCSRGIYLSCQNKYKEAIADFTTAIRLEPKFIYAYCRRANTYRLMEDYKKAIKDYTRAIESSTDSTTSSSSFEAYRMRGLIYEKMGNYDNALKNYEEAIEIFPDEPVFWENRADIYMERKQYDKAIADCTKWIEMDPEDDDAYSNRAAAYFMKNNFESAILDLNKAIELNPEGFHTGSYYFARGLCYAMLGEKIKAIASFAKANQLGYK